MKILHDLMVEAYDAAYGLQAMLDGCNRDVQREGYAHFGIDVDALPPWEPPGENMPREQFIELQAQSFMVTLLKREQAGNGRCEMIDKTKLRKLAEAVATGWFEPTDPKLSMIQGHKDRDFLCAASPDTVLALLDDLAIARTALERIRDLRTAGQAEPLRATARDALKKLG